MRYSTHMMECLPIHNYTPFVWMCFSNKTRIHYLVFHNPSYELPIRLFNDYRKNVLCDFGIPFPLFRIFVMFLWMLLLDSLEFVWLRCPCNVYFVEKIILKVHCTYVQLDMALVQENLRKKNEIKTRVQCSVSFLCVCEFRICTEIVTWQGFMYTAESIFKPVSESYHWYLSG